MTDENYVERLYKKKTEREAKLFTAKANHKDVKRRKFKREPPRGYREREKAIMLSEFIKNE